MFWLNINLNKKGVQMNRYKSAIIVFGILIISSSLSFAQIKDSDYKVLNYTTVIEDGDALQKNLLLKSDENVIANVTLRNGKALGVHTEKNVFWVLGTAGSGKLVLGDNEKTIELKPGVMVTVKAGIPHDVIAEPNLSILVIKMLK
jgi:quercetin dioxygenase-like cupin family protein